MQSITQDIIKAIRRNFWILLLFSALITGLSEMFPTRSGNSGGSFVAVTIVIYYLHRQVLFDLRLRASGKPIAPEGAEIPKDSMGRFMLVSALFAVLAIGPGVVAAIKWASGHGSFNRNQALGIMVMIGIPLLWLLLSLIGTLLPAAASRLPFSLARAWQAGRKTGLVVAFQLLVFSGLTFLAVLALSLLLAWAFGAKLDVAPLSYVVQTIFGALFMLPSLMTVVILVRAFKRAYAAS